jgi:hypothetical protein
MAVTVDDKTKKSDGGVAVEEKTGAAGSDLRIDARGEVVGGGTKELTKQRLKLDTWG